MALAGALIVFSGLVILSLAISQLPKLVAYLDRREALAKQKHQPPPTEPVQPEAEPLPKYLPADINEVAQYYQPLIDEIGTPFSLSKLYELSARKGYPHPHLTITSFRRANILQSHGDGTFSWNLPAHNPT